MISIIHRYIAKTVITTTLLVVLVVMALTYFINLLGELRDIGVGDYGVAQAALHSLLELPHNIYQFFPMLVLLGGLMGLGILASNHELIVMRVSGISINKIVRAVLSAAIVLALFGVLIGEVISPRAHFLADRHKTSAENGGQAIATATGVWIHEGTNFIHIDREINRHHLEGVTRYEFDSTHHLLTSSYAKALDYSNGQWQLHDLVTTVFLKGHTSHQQSAEATWELTLNPNLLSAGLVEPDEMPLNRLAEYTKHLVDNGLQSNEFQFNFWKRIFQPLTILIMLLLAVPFIFSAPRSVTMGLRMLLGVVIGFIFYILDALLGQLCIVFQWSPILAALLPVLLFAGLGQVWLARTRQ